MDQKVLKIYEDMKEVSDKHIREKKNIGFTCFMIEKNYSISPLLLEFENSKEKLAARNYLKKLLVNRPIKGYVIICAVKMTAIDKTDPRKGIAKDAVMRNLYTSKGRRVNVVSESDGKPLFKFTKEMMKEWKDEWDLWGEKIEVDPELNKTIAEFKQEHKELYKDVGGPFEDWYVGEDDFGQVKIAWKFDHEKKIIYYYARDEEDRKKLSGGLGFANSIYKKVVAEDYELIEVNKDGKKI